MSTMVVWKCWLLMCHSCTQLKFLLLHLPQSIASPHHSLTHGATLVQRSWMLTSWMLMKDLFITMNASELVQTNDRKVDQIRPNRLKPPVSGETTPLCPPTMTDFLKSWCSVLCDRKPRWLTSPITVETHSCRHSCRPSLVSVQSVSTVFSNTCNTTWIQSVAQHRPKQSDGRQSVRMNISVQLGTTLMVVTVQGVFMLVPAEPGLFLEVPLSKRGSWSYSHNDKIDFIRLARDPRRGRHRLSSWGHLFLLVLFSPGEWQSVQLNPSNWNHSLHLWKQLKEKREPENWGRETYLLPCKSVTGERWQHDTEQKPITLSTASSLLLSRGQLLITNWSPVG